MGLDLIWEGYFSFFTAESEGKIYESPCKRTSALGYLRNAYFFTYFHLLLMHLILFVLVVDSLYPL